MLASLDAIKDREESNGEFIRLILPAAGGPIDIARRFRSYTPLLLSTRQLISERNAAPPYFHAHPDITRRDRIDDRLISTIRTGSPPSPFLSSYLLSHSRNLSILHM